MRMYTSAAATLLLAAAAATALPAAAQGAAGSDRQARVWAASCAACHGPEGRGQGAIPAIAGRNADELRRLLLAFKAGQRPEATVMHQHAKGYSDEELQRIAGWYAALPQ